MGGDCNKFIFRKFFRVKAVNVCYDKYAFCKCTGLVKNSSFYCGKSFKSSASLYKNSLTAPICLTNYLVAEFARQNYEESKEVLSRTESVLSSGYYLGL